MTHTKAQARVWQAAYNKAMNAESGKLRRAGDFSTKSSIDAHAKAIRAGDAAVRKQCPGGKCIRGRRA